MDPRHHSGKPAPSQRQDFPSLEHLNLHHPLIVLAKLPTSPNVSLLSLPAGSPELNPAEQVWQQVRDRSLANRCYGSYEHIVDACCEARNQFIQIPGAIRSLCTRNWANLAYDHGIS
jgi:hypothetical protein